MRILVAGDTHGNNFSVQRAINTAVNNGCDRIFQVGDFGFWPHVESGKQFLLNVGKWLEDADLEMDWIDGNHENHDWLAMQDHVEGVWSLGGRLHHHARGHRWEWEGVTFLACGGAYSIDKEYRRAGFSWWEGETITKQDALRCAVGGKVDVMFTHDAPADAARAIPAHGSLDRQKDRWPASLANRQLLQSIVDSVKPKLLVHGHYHHRNRETLAKTGTRIEGLSNDAEPGSMIVLTLPELTVEGVYR